MDTVHDDPVLELKTSLTNLIEHTETIFLELGDSFPVLIREMEAGIRNSQTLIDGFRSGDNGDTHSEIFQAIAATRQTVEEAGDTFKNMHRKDNQLLDELERNMKKLAALDEVIGAIREDSTEIEIVSLNAMTMAVKAGTSGKAFSYITDELKRLSVRTITLTEDISRTEERLLKIFNQYRTEIDGIRKGQEALFGELRDRLFESFERFSGGVQELAGVLYSISNNSSEVKTPLIGIMEGVQVHDIIRQSIQHVIIALDAYNAADLSSEDDEVRLDEQYFIAELSDLCLKLMSDIEENLQNCIDDFKRNMQEIRTIIDGVDRERREFSSSTSVFGLFDDSSLMLKNLINDLWTIMKQKRKVAETGFSLLQEIEAIEEQFRVFSTLLSRFRNVDIAARIEVAKQAILQKMKSTVESLTALIGKIGDDVGGSLGGTKEFVEKTCSLVKEYAGAFESEEDTVKKFEERIRGNYDALTVSRNILSEKISSFSTYTGDFLTLLNKGLTRLDRLSLLMQDIRGISDTLSSLRTSSRLALEDELNRQSRPAWELRNTKLKGIIENFTIRTHKKAAGDIGGFEVEEGTATGEVTMFT